MSRNNGAYAESPAKKIRACPTATMKPPHNARLRSNGVRAEKCRAGVSVIGNGALPACCHQSSSSTRLMPVDVTSRRCRVA